MGKWIIIFPGGFREHNKILNAQKGRVSAQFRKNCQQSELTEKKVVWSDGFFNTEMFKQKGLPLTKVPVSVHGGIIELWFRECLRAWGPMKFVFLIYLLPYIEYEAFLSQTLRDDSVNHSSIATPQIQWPCIYHYSFCNLFPLENQNFHYGTVRLRYQWCFGWTANVINPVSMVVFYSLWVNW